MVSFPLASNYTRGLLLRFLDTTATNAVSLSFCKTVLLILNPSHRAQDELWGTHENLELFRQDQTSILFLLGNVATSAFLLWGR